MKTKGDLMRMSRRELLDLVMSAKGCTGSDPTKPESYFQGKFDTEFSYSDLCNQLRRLGATNGWYFPDELSEQHKDEMFESTEEESFKDSDIVELRKLRKEEIKRQTYVVPGDIAEEWAEFTSVSPSKAILLGAAMRRFMADAKAGVVQVVQRWS